MNTLYSPVWNEIVILPSIDVIPMSSSQSVAPTATSTAVSSSGGGPSSAMPTSTMGACINNCHECANDCCVNCSIGYSISDCSCGKVYM